MTTLWTLILFAHVGMMGKGDSNSLASVPNFKDKAACVAAGNDANDMASGTTKIIKFVCVRDSSGQQ